MCTPYSGVKSREYRHYTGTVYLSDTDAMGIAHHSRYLIWFENARTVYLTNYGLSIAALQARNLSFPVAKVSVSHYAPLELGNQFSVSITAVDIKGSYIRFSAELYNHLKPTENMQCIADSKITLACINRLDKQTNEIPEDLKSILIEK